MITTASTASPNSFTYGQCAKTLLRQGRLPAELAEYEQNLSGPFPLRAEALGSLLDLFKTLKDKRRGHGLRHRQAFVLACATVAMLMGAGGYQAFEDVSRKLSQRQLRACLLYTSPSPRD